MFYAYIVRCSDNSLYSGFATDVQKRIDTHNSGKGAKYTKTRLPVTLCYFEEFESKNDALKRECYFKTLTKYQKEHLIKYGEILPTTKDKIISLVNNIPTGKVATYSEIGAKIGVPVLTVGRTVKALKGYKLCNKFRVVDGSGCVISKNAVSKLKAEGVEVAKGTVDLKVYGWKF